MVVGEHAANQADVFNLHTPPGTTCRDTDTNRLSLYSQQEWEAEEEVVGKLEGVGSIQHLAEVGSKFRYLKSESWSSLNVDSDEAVKGELWDAEFRVCGIEYALYSQNYDWQ